MRFQRTIRRFRGLGWPWAAFGVALLLVGCVGVRRTVTVGTSPTGATVKIDGAVKGESPHTEKLDWTIEKGQPSSHTVRVELPDYEPRSRVLSMAEAKTNKSPWGLYLRLDPLFDEKEARFVTEPPGAAVSVQGAGLPSAAPCNLRVRFTRPNSRSPWSALTATASLTNYLTTTARFTREQIVANAEVKIELPRIREEFQVDITCNTNATVKVDGQEVGLTPLHRTFVFTRTDGSALWSTFQVTVEKDGWYYKMERGDPQPFSEIFAREEAAKGKLDVELKPVRFVRSPVIVMVPTPEGKEPMQFITNNVLSQVEKTGTEPPVVPVASDPDPDKPELAKYETRISVMTNSLDFVFSIPRWLPQAPDRACFNLWAQRGNARTHITEGAQRDIEATVSPDGQWIYFSSDRLPGGRYTIWRMPGVGRGGMTKITDSPSSVIDTEAAVSPDGKKLAYTSWPVGGKSPQVWIANSDGSLATQVCGVGHSPCWSPDGTKIAYAKPDAAGREKIWKINLDGTEDTRVIMGEGDYAELYPVWVPDGKRIIYACDQAAIEGEHNFDIWIVKVDGSVTTQLTFDGSYDTRPAVSPDGKYVFFMSNRGANKPGQRNLKIYRLELPPE